MAILFQTNTFVELEFESDLSLSFGGVPIIHTQDTDKYWKVMRGTYVETNILGIPYIQNLTDAQLRASAVPVTVSGTVTLAATPTIDIGDVQILAGSAIIGKMGIDQTTPGTTNKVTLGADIVAVTGPLTDAQMRAVAVPVSAAALPLPSGAASAALQTQPGVDIGDVTVNNAAGANAVNIQDGGNSITVDGTVGATQSGPWNIGSISTLPSLAGGSAIIGKVGIDQTTPGTTNKVSLGSDVVSTQKSNVIYRGSAATFRIPGRAGTVGQKILSIHNATGSAISLRVRQIRVDLVQTVVKAITVLPPVVRVWAVTVLPTNGTALTKNKIGGTGATNATATLLQDASADGTGSASTLTATLPAGTIINQEYAPRFITGAGYEMGDRLLFEFDDGIVLGALQGIVVFVDYVLATQNPTTDMWLASVEWDEY